MRKLYALWAGLVLMFTAATSNALPVTPDVANFTFTVDHPNKDVVFTNTSTLGSDAGIRRAFWSFGDGSGAWSGPLQGTQHHYQAPGTYNVCLKIFLYRPSHSDSILSAQICKTIVINTVCRADFEKLPPTAASGPLLVTYRAIPWINNTSKPVRICWTFGDGSDTCINYTTAQNGPYTVTHRYNYPGLYEVCVNILYYGGCEARKCNAIQVGRPDTCAADFERIATPNSSPLQVYFKALPQHNNNRKPARVCWNFGDGNDTCINYPENFTGQYVTSHRYSHAGSYNVCVRIRYYGGCEADKCHPIQVARPDTCAADFERIPSSSNNPLQTYFRALPQHNNNRKPARICWNFGDGSDTCINYSETFTGQYVTSHRYNYPGSYNVCVRIQYYGSCLAEKCHPIQVGRPDTCAADFERIPSSSNNPLQTYFRALPQHNNNRKPARICWNFGDGSDTCINYSETFTGQYVTSHRYNNPGSYNVCVRIRYYGGCEADKCHAIQVGRPDTCGADFTRIPSPNNSPLQVYFKALPQHNNNRKPARVCWNFGDGRDTCINYPETFTGQYVTSHRYSHAGSYNVCVRIRYYGGCEADKCHPIQVGRPDTCAADFERLPVAAGTPPLRAYFKALPLHNNNRKPARVCWRFGDGQDTCINYSETFTGQYVVGHTYNHAGLYEVCVRILYYGGCEAEKCRQVPVGRPDTCAADFERILAASSPLLNYFKALPQHNNNRKPARVCWRFGDGQDTCITYPENYTGQYVVSHRYQHTGEYNVCVNILYYGGCEAEKCHRILVPPVPQACTVRLFEITPSITSLVRGFLAVPSSTPTRRPERICWYFGDGQDTCIMIDPGQPLPNFIIRHTYPGPGEYRACVRVRFEGGCVAEDCKQVIIRSTTNVCGGYMTDSMLAPRTLKFRGYGIHNPGDQVLNYYWSFGDGISAAGQEVTHTYAQGGSYQVCLLIRTRLGCETRICKTIQVPGNNAPQLHLSPNPVVSTLFVDFFSTQTEQITIRILNNNGVQVRSYTRNVTVGNNNWSHDLANLLPGLYSYVVQSPNQLASALFIKQ